MKVVYSLLLLAALQLGHMWVSETMPWQGGTAKAGELSSVEEKLDRLLEQSTTDLKLSLGQEICRLYFARMEANSPAVDGILSESYDEKQAEYAELNEGRRYNVDECQRPASPNAPPA